MTLNRRIIGILFCALSISGISIGHAQTLTSFGVGKKLDFLQVSSATATSHTILGDPNGPFHFSANLSGSSLNLLSPAPKVTLPNSTQFTLTGTSSSMGLATSYSGKSALDAAFPNGTYSFSAGSSTLMLAMGSSDTYPAEIPKISNGTWDTQGRLLIDSAAGGTLNFNNFTGYGSGAGGIVTFTIYAISGTTLSTQLLRIESVALAGYGSEPILSSYPIAPGFLQSDRTYYAELSFARIVQLNTAASPAVGSATFLHTTGFILSTSVPTSAPVFTTQPTGQTVTVGANVTLTAIATGNPVPTYQWRKNGANITGAVLASLTLNNVQLADAGSYTVVASNSVSNTTSNAAVLTVNTSAVAPSFTTQPVSQVVTAGNPITFTAAASGEPAPTYQWKKDGVNLTGATSTTFTIANVAGSDAGTYTVVASNSVSPVTSNAATLTVNSASATVTLGGLSATYDGTSHAATATTMPADLVVTFTYDGSATAPTNAGTYAVVATINEANYQGSASGSLVIAKATPAITWAAPTAIPYGMAVSGTQLNATANATGNFAYSPAAGAVLAVGSQTLAVTFTPADTANYNSASAQRTISVSTTATAPSFTTQPQSQAAFVGATVTLATAADAIPAPTYQWQKNGVNVAGATGPTLALTNVQLTDAGTYAVIATNTTGPVTSKFARLVVLVPQPNAITYGTTVISTGVTAGGRVNLDYFLTNNGTQSWGANHYLSIRDINGTFVAWASLIGVMPGESKTATFSFVAPATPGTYTYYVQALENGVEFFGTQAAVTLTVLASQPNSITYNSTTFPISVAPGSSLNFNYNVTNTGTKTWGANHYLTLQDSHATSSAFAALDGVVPGQSKTVNLSFTAPTAPGIYSYTVQAQESGVEFFNTQANLTLVVLAPRPNAIVYNSTRHPDDLTPGATANLRYSLSNAGTQAWGASHYVSLRDNNGTYLSFIPLDGVAAGGTRTVDFNFVAPTIPGTYIYYVQALENGIEFFATQDVVIVTVVPASIPNGIAYNATTFPNTAARGATVNLTSNVTNRGTKTWGANHYLSLRDADGTFLSIQPLAGSAPGSSQTLNLSFVAPSTPGYYTYAIQGFEDSVEFFSMSDTLVLLVQ